MRKRTYHTGRKRCKALLAWKREWGEIKRERRQRKHGQKANSKAADSTTQSGGTTKLARSGRRNRGPYRDHRGRLHHAHH